MMTDSNVDHRLAEALALLALRVSLGMLLVWWGLSRIVQPGSGVGIQKKFYHELFPDIALQHAFGYVEAAIGALVAVGLLRRFVVPAQLAITGFSAVMIWSALIDPFGLWLPVAKIAPIQHLFYPSVIALAGAGVVIAFRDRDRFALDVALRRLAERRGTTTAAA